MTIRVLIDARKLGDGGIGVYIENLVDGLLSLAQPIRPNLTLLVQPDAPEQHDCLLEWGDRVKLLPESSGKYSLSELVMLPMRQREAIGEHDIYHSPHYTLPFLSPPFSPAIPSVVTVHDVIHLTHPETLVHRPVGKLMIGSALRRANQVITVSEASQARIKEIFGETAPITVIHNALRKGIGLVSDTEVRMMKSTRGITRDYCIFVGSDRPHKGFAELVAAWERLKSWSAAEGRHMPQLHAVGSRYSDALKAEIRQRGLAEDLVFAGDLSVDQLNLLYNGALAVIVPSREEGFGFTALEGMACGVPVVCSAIPSLHEVCGDTVWYSPLVESEALFRTIIDLFSRREDALDRAERGIKRARLFSREELGQKTNLVYRRVLGSAEDDTLSLKRKAFYLFPEAARKGGINWNSGELHRSSADSSAQVEARTAHNGAIRVAGGIFGTVGGLG